MQLEAGKKYTDRRGRVYGPLIQNSTCFGEGPKNYAWSADGRISSSTEYDMDLVAEYVEPVQPEPEYRLLKDGETVQPGDEYCGHSGKWEKVPSTGNVFRSSLYYPHRRLVDPVKAAEPAPAIDNRVPAGEGYRLLDIGEAEQKGDQWFDRVKGQWREACLINAKINKNDLIQGYSIRRKVEQPAPVESPDDWVILDPVVYADHVPRVGIDQFQGWDDQWTTQEYFHSKQPIGLWNDATGGNQTRCRRRDLPPVPPAEPEFPQYIIYATGGTFADCAYIVRTSEDDAYSVLANGKRGVDFKWVAYKANILKSGVWKRVTEKEAEKLVSRTRTVVLKEWLCWEDAEPETVTLDWCSTSPADETDQFSAWDNAVETGNTRTVEIPVT